MLNIDFLYGAADIARGKYFIRKKGTSLYYISYLYSFNKHMPMGSVYLQSK